MTTLTPLQAALTAANLGYKVIPLHPGKKKPLQKGWQSLATSDLDIILSMWSSPRLANAMVGVVTGKASGRFVIDIDPEEECPWAILAELEAEYGPIEAEMYVRTPSGGLHVYVPVPADGKVPNSTKTLWRKVDVRGDGGFAVFAFSVNSNGKSYRIVNKGE